MNDYDLNVAETIRALMNGADPEELKKDLGSGLVEDAMSELEKRI